jgi:hypothetical protein
MVCLDFGEAVIDETEIVLQNVICLVFAALTVYRWSSSNIALCTVYQ